MLKLILIWLQDERLKMFGGCSKSYCLRLIFWNSYIVLIFEHRFLMLAVNLIVVFFLAGYLQFMYCILCIWSNFQSDKGLY